MLFGGVDYNDETRSSAVVREAGAKRADTAGRLEPLPFLPAALAEVERIAALWPGPQERDLVLRKGVQASRESLLGIAPRARFLHVATHNLLESAPPSEVEIPPIPLTHRRARGAWRGVELEKHARAPSDLRPPSAAGALAELIEACREDARAWFAGAQPAEPALVAEAFVLLLAYGCAIEKILAGAAGGEGTLPGHAVSLRAYVDQLLAAEAQGSSRARLVRYFADAVERFERTHLGVEAALASFAADLARALKPARIEERVAVSPLLRSLGLHEGAYWREFRRIYHSLDAAGVRKLAR